MLTPRGIKGAQMRLPVLGMATRVQVRMLCIMRGGDGVERLIAAMMYDWTT